MPPVPAVLERSIRNVVAIDPSDHWSSTRVGWDEAVARAEWKEQHAGWVKVPNTDGANQDYKTSLEIASTQTAFSCNPQM
jgi:hypothetical protein